MKFGIGQALTRVEDQRFITGAGHYATDARAKGEARAFVLRAPFAHATFRIRNIEEARAIYRHDYIERPGFLRIPDDRLRALLVDWGVHSGPQTAIRALQRVLGVRPDGVLGPLTLAALQTRPAADVYASVLRWRGLWMADILQRDPKQRVFAAGWLRRLMEFV